MFASNAVLLHIVDIPQMHFNLVPVLELCGTQIALVVLDLTVNPLLVLLHFVKRVEHLLAYGTFVSDVTRRQVSLQSHLINEAQPANLTHERMCHVFLVHVCH